MFVGGAKKWDALRIRRRVSTGLYVQEEMGGCWNGEMMIVKWIVSDKGEEKSQMDG